MFQGQFIHHTAVWPLVFISVDSLGQVTELNLQLVDGDRTRSYVTFIYTG